MSRKSRQFNKPLIADPIYNSLVLTKFINKVMLGGKKSKAQGIVYKSLEALSKSVGEDPLPAFEKVIKNVRPLMEVKSRRVGGSTYQVPIEVRPERGVTLAIRWIINITRSKSNKSFQERLTTELIDAYNRAGASIKKREDTHKMADANKAFAHFRW